MKVIRLLREQYSDSVSTFEVAAVAVSAVAAGVVLAAVVAVLACTPIKRLSILR